MDLNESAVLLITFNRPDTTKNVFEAIQLYKPKKLYIFSDGPRAEKLDSDWLKIQETRKIFENLDWECVVKTKYMEPNQGCGNGVSGAIGWAFELEDQLIILEDDCVPSLSFFSFCNTLLNKYANDERIMHISGTRWNEEFFINTGDYFYTKYAHIWGWATWKRAWEKYDFLMSDWPDFKQKQFLYHIEDNSFSLIKRWTFLFDNIYNIKVKHTWDYQWQYTLFKNNGLCINATKNMVTNIGDDGVHSSERTEAHFRNRDEIGNELISPAFFQPEYEFDKYHARKFFLNDRSNLKILYDSVIGNLTSLLKLTIILK